MRLLNTHALELKTFPGRDGRTPQYAILSHCWSENAGDEVLFNDIQDGTARDKKAFSKLSTAMAIASQKYDWIWCSSAELSEAINSMYTYYQNAAVCYAYLEDKIYSSVTELESSKWFSRGWTLQELIAPPEVIFFDRNWTRVGSKTFTAIQNMVSQRTKIEADILDGSRVLQSVSIAQRMSWAAGREVTRPEDIAYSLMGVFQVNMPMLYGEGGERAFHRLQEHIMATSNDHSLFAWTVSINSKMPEQHGLLADSPSAFADASNIVGYNDWEDDENDEQPFSQTNLGLRINLRLDPAEDGTYYAALNCPIPSLDRGYYGFLAIRLKKLATGKHQYTRVRCHEIKGLAKRPLHSALVNVRQKPLVDDEHAVMPWHFFMPQNLTTHGDGYELLSARFYRLEQYEKRYEPKPIIQATSWFAAAQASAFPVTRREGRISAMLYFRRSTDQAPLTLVLGALNDFEVGFGLALEGPDASIEQLEKSIRLQPSGSTMEIRNGNHQARVDVTIRLDPPRKLYILDITLIGTAPAPMVFRPPAVTPQQVLLETTNYIVDDVREVVSDSRYRPMSLLRGRRRG